MRVRRTFTVAGLVVGLLSPGAVFAGVESSLTVEPRHLILGLPYKVKIELANRSGEAVEAVWPRHMTLVLQDPGLWVLPEGGGVLPPIGGFSAAVTIAYQQLAPGDRLSYALESDQQVTSLPRFCAPGKYRIGVRVPVRLAGGKQVTCEAWTDVEVVTPEGVDASAFAFLYGCEVGESEQCTCSRRVVYGPLGGSDGELLRRFPTSTYAAFVIWQRWAKGVVPSWKDDNEREKFLRILEKDPSHEYLTWKLPCREDGVPDADVITRFKMPAAARCRDAWLEIGLKYHQESWFADEIRLRLALDRYILGDKGGSEALLEELAAKGKPYVAKKVKKLLAAMRAKGMLGEGP